LLASDKAERIYDFLGHSYFGMSLTNPTPERVVAWLIRTLLDEDLLVEFDDPPGCHAVQADLCLIIDKLVWCHLYQAMIYVSINEPESDVWGHGNPYITALGVWKDWCKDHGLTYLPAGSERGDIAPGHWCIRSYTREGATANNWYLRYPRRMVCFNDQDSDLAMLFKLTWG
jgi:hypothetical protein